MIAIRQATLVDAKRRKQAHAEGASTFKKET